MNLFIDSGLSPFPGTLQILSRLGLFGEAANLNFVLCSSAVVIGVHGSFDCAVCLGRPRYSMPVRAPRQEVSQEDRTSLSTYMYHPLHHRRGSKTMSSSRRRLAALALLAATDAGRGSASEAASPNTKHEHGQGRIIRPDDDAIDAKPMPMPMPAANSGTCASLW